MGRGADIVVGDADSNARLVAADRTAVADIHGRLIDPDDLAEAAEFVVHREVVRREDGRAVGTAAQHDAAGGHFFEVRGNHAVAGATVDVDGEISGLREVAVEHEIALAVEDLDVQSKVAAEVESLEADVAGTVQLDERRAYIGEFDFAIGGSTGAVHQKVESLAAEIDTPLAGLIELFQQVDDPPRLFFRAEWAVVFVADTVGDECVVRIGCGGKTDGLLARIDETYTGRV